MNHVKSFTLSTLILVVVAQAAVAARPPSVPGSRPISLSWAFPAVDSSAPFWNPARLAGIKENKANFAFHSGGSTRGGSINFMAPNFNLSSAVSYMPLEYAPAEAHLRRMKRLFIIGFGLKSPVDEIDFGFNIKAVSEDVYGVVDASNPDTFAWSGTPGASWSMDLGVIYKLKRKDADDRILVQAILQDIKPYKLVMDFQQSTTSSFLPDIPGWTDEGGNRWSYRVTPNLNLGVILQKANGFNLAALLGANEMHVGLETRFLEQRITIRLGYSSYGIGTDNEYVKQNILSISFGYIIKGSIMMMIEDNTESTFGESDTMSERFKDLLKKTFGQNFGINYSMSVDVTGSSGSQLMAMHMFTFSKHF